MLDKESIECGHVDVRVGCVPGEEVKTTLLRLKEMGLLAKDLKLELVYYTPAAALAEVESEGHNNFRNKRSASVENYKNQMLKNLWYIGPPLVKDTENHLIDGQNRLWAVHESGTGQWFLVLSGVPKECAVAFDNGTPRTRTEVLTFLFRDHPWIMELFDGAPTGTISAILVAVNGGLHDTFLANSELLSAVRMHKDVLAFIVEYFFPLVGKKRRKMQGITRAHTAGAFGRAFITHRDNPKKLAKIKEAAGKLVNGFDLQVEPKYAGFSKLRDYLVTMGATGVSGSAANTIVYQRVSKCLLQVLEGQKTTFVKPATYEVKGRLKLKVDEGFVDPFPVVISTASMVPPANMIPSGKKSKKNKKT